MTSIKKKKFSYFIGIDISRNKLDYAILKGKQLLEHWEAANNTKEIELFLNKVKGLENFKMANALFCMEHTGFYANHLLAILTKFKANIMVEHPLQIKNSLGVLRGKYDKVDSIRIAKYAEKSKEEYVLWEPRRPVVLTLMNMVALRNRLLVASVSLKTPLKEQSTFIKTDIHAKSIELCNQSLTAIKSEITAINSEIQLLINGDDHLKRLFRVITSVPGVGAVTAVQIIICTNEFKDITSPKKFACYAGVAPFKRESGMMKGRARVSAMANKDMKRLLHLCAMVSVHVDAEIKTYFERKTKKESKPGMLVMNAIRNKIILRIFACLKGDRLFDKTRKPTVIYEKLTDEEI